mgnify:FL=1
MADASNELLLQVLRQVQADIGEIKKDVAGIKSDLADVEQKVDGLTVMFTLLAGHVYHVEQRVEALEAART